MTESERSERWYRGELERGRRRMGPVVRAIVERWVREGWIAYAEFEVAWTGPPGGRGEP